jgi:hypothetical protein
VDVFAWEFKASVHDNVQCKTYSKNRNETAQLDALQSQTHNYATDGGDSGHIPRRIANAVNGTRYYTGNGTRV